MYIKQPRIIADTVFRCLLTCPSFKKWVTHTSEVPSTLLLTPASLSGKSSPISQLFPHKSSHFPLPVIIHAWVLPSLSLEDVTVAGGLCPHSLKSPHKSLWIQVAWSSHFFCPAREGDGEGILDSTQAWWGFYWGWSVSSQGSPLTDWQVAYLSAGISADLLPRNPGASPLGAPTFAGISHLWRVSQV